MQETPQIAEKWRRFKQTGCQKARCELIEHYLPLVRSAARARKVCVPLYVRFDDLESAAHLGLVQAVDKYDLGRGWSFMTYADRRMRGAMLDWQRAIDPVPRDQGQQYMRSRQMPKFGGLDVKAFDLPDRCDVVRIVHNRTAAESALKYTTKLKGAALWALANGGPGGAKRQCLEQRRKFGKIEIRAACSADDYIWD